MHNWPQVQKEYRGGGIGDWRTPPVLRAIILLSSKGIICSGGCDPTGYILLFTYVVYTLQSYVAAVRTGFSVRQHLTKGQRMVTEYLYHQRWLVSARGVEVLAKSFLPVAKTIHAIGFQCGILQDGIFWTWDL